MTISKRKECENGHLFEGRYCPQCAPQGFNKVHKQEEECKSCGVKPDIYGRCGCSS